MESMGVYFIFNKKKLQYVHKLPMTPRIKAKMKTVTWKANDYIQLQWLLYKLS